MRRFFIVAICFAGIILFAESCRKNTDNGANGGSTTITGTWELRETSAAMTPSITYHPSGNGNILKFTDSTYQTYVNGQLTKSGKYTVIKDSTVQDNVCLVFPAWQYSNRIIYDSIYNSTKVFIQLSNNKLSFISGCYAIDAGHTETFEKTGSQ